MTELHEIKPSILRSVAEGHETTARDYAATAARRLRELADQVERDMRGDAPPEILAYEIPHVVTWGVANMNLDSFSRACVEWAKNKAAADISEAFEAKS